MLERVCQARHIRQRESLHLPGFETLVALSIPATQINSLEIRKMPRLGKFECLRPHPERCQCPFDSDRVSTCQLIELVQDLAEIHRSYERPPQDTCEGLRIRIPIHDSDQQRGVHEEIAA